MDGDRKKWRHLSRQIRGLVFGASGRLFRRERNRSRRRRNPPRTARLAGGVDRGRILLLPSVGLSGQIARALRARSRLRAAARTPERGIDLRQKRPAGYL